MFHTGIDDWFLDPEYLAFLVRDLLKVLFLPFLWP